MSSWRLPAYSIERGTDMEAVRDGTRWPRVSSQSGLALLEILLALGLISISLLALAGAFPAGVGGVAVGKQQTTAIFLAEQRMEQIKGTDFASITAANFPNEAYGAATLPAGYRRTVVLTNNPGGMTNAVRADVSVFYQPILAFGVLAAERQVTTSSVVSLH
jgi:type II secretory pathway pseudopilin PulG